MLSRHESGLCFALKEGKDLVIFGERGESVCFKGGIIVVNVKLPPTLFSSVNDGNFA